jgi:hypothetical protein
LENPSQILNREGECRIAKLYSSAAGTVGNQRLGDGSTGFRAEGRIHSGVMAILARQSKPTDFVDYFVD